MRTNTWWKIGWRSLSRNKKRSFITATALACGYFAVVLMAGLMEGIIADMIDSGTGLMSGQLQVHAEEYLPERSIYNTLGSTIAVDELVGLLEADPIVEAASPRVFGGGLISSGTKTSAAALVGIDPDREPLVSRFPAAITAGRLPRSGANELLVGSELARRLGSAAGDEVVVVAPAADGSLGNDLYDIVGIFETGHVALDASHAFLALDVLQFLLAIPEGRVHEVAARIRNPWDAPQATSRVSHEFSNRWGAQVRDWTAYRPELVDFARLAGSSMWILLVVVFGMAIFGVANTMFMATFERRREFAVLLAMGASPRGIVFAVLSEAIALGILALVVGIGITIPVMAWWKSSPPDLSGLVGGFTMGGSFLEPVLRVEYPVTMMINGALALFLTAALAALLPAFRAGRVPPADTLMGR